MQMNNLQINKWLGSSVGTSARLKIVRSTVRSCPEPLLFFFINLQNLNQKGLLFVAPEVPHHCVVHRESLTLIQSESGNQVRPSYSSSLLGQQASLPSYLRFYLTCSQSTPQKEFLRNKSTVPPMQWRLGQSLACPTYRARYRLREQQNHKSQQRPTR